MRFILTELNTTATKNNIRLSCTQVEGVREMDKSKKREEMLQY